MPHRDAPLVPEDDPILHRKATPVTRFGNETMDLAREMVRAMEDAGGVGLAANQIGRTERMAVIRLEEWEHPLVLVNLRVAGGRDTMTLPEACLSIPGRSATVTRHRSVRATAQDLAGRRIRLDAQGTLAPRPTARGGPPGWNTLHPEGPGKAVGDVPQPPQPHRTGLHRGRHGRRPGSRRRRPGHQRGKHPRGNIGGAGRRPWPASPPPWPGGGESPGWRAG